MHIYGNLDIYGDVQKLRRYALYAGGAGDRIVQSLQGF